MKRRDFIQLSAFTAAAISLPLLHSCGPASSQHIMSKPMFLSRLFDESSVKDAGKTYLQKNQGENDEKKLIGLLSDNSSIANSSDETFIHQYLDQKVKHDFETGATVLVKGWVLSVTEARQCALFSLINL